MARWLFGGMLAFSTLLASPASADIYRWEDESGVIHFTDDLSTVPAKYRGKAREIQKTPPKAGRPSVSTMGAPSSPPGPSLSPEAVGRRDARSTGAPAGRRRHAAEKLRAKIDAKERFVRGVDEKQSLATNPYRNRIVSPSDLELYKKYKEELPADREHSEGARVPPCPRQGAVTGNQTSGWCLPVAPAAGVPHEREARSGAPYVSLR